MKPEVAGANRKWHLVVSQRPSEEAVRPMRPPKGLSSLQVCYSNTTAPPPRFQHPQISVSMEDRADAEAHCIFLLILQMGKTEADREFVAGVELQKRRSADVSIHENWAS